MSRAGILRYVLLAALLLFVEWFGVWELYHLMAPSIGGLWAGMMALFAALGVVVIGIIGVILIRTKDKMESADAPAVDERPPDT